MRSDWRIHPELECLDPVVDKTYGILIYQEQVLQALNALCGWDYTQADDVLYAMRKKDHEALSAARPSFFRDGLSRGHSQQALEAVWETLVPFADYSFSASHSVAYAKISYFTAYLKALYPIQYMTAILSTASEKEDDKTKLSQKQLYLSECARMGIPILPPDINDSGMNFTATPKGIRYGLASIKGLGEAATKPLVSGRPYRTLDEFFRKADAKVLNAGVLKALGESGALDSLWPSREELVPQLPEIAVLASEDRKQRRKGQRKLFGVKYQPKKEAGQTEKDNQLRAEWELRTLGVVLTHPQVILRPQRPLSASEWGWVHSRLDQSPGSSKVIFKLNSSQTEAKTQVALTDYLIQQLKLVDVEVSEG